MSDSSDTNEPDSVDLEAVLEQAESERTDWEALAEDALAWFQNHGDVYERSNAVALLAAELDVDEPRVERTIAHLIEDHVDPVQQIATRAGRYVGVLSYQEHDEWWYSFTEFDSLTGEHERGVCGVCVAAAERDTEPFTRKTDPRGQPPVGGGRDDLARVMDRHYVLEHADLDVERVLEALGVSAGELLERIERDVLEDDLLQQAALDDVTVQQIVDAYDVTLADLEDYIDTGAGDLPDVEPGATLASGTTINSQTAWHDGNVSGGTAITVGATSVAHADTSTQSDVDNSGATGIQDVTLDGEGHVTGLTSADLGGGGAVLSATDATLAKVNR